jgi:hypothetical protein
MTASAAPVSPEFDLINVTVPAIHARIGDTLIYREGDNQREGTITSFRIIPQRTVLGGSGDIVDRIEFELDGEWLRRSWQNGEYVSIRRAAPPAPQAELRQIEHPDGTAYLYQEALILAGRYLTGRWKIYLSDGRRVFSELSGCDEGDYRREAMRVIDAALDEGAGELPIDHEALITARFLSGEKLQTQPARPIPMEVSRGIYSYRGYKIEVEDDRRWMQNYATARIISPAGDVESVSCSRRVRNNEQAGTCAKRIDKILDN